MFSPLLPQNVLFLTTYHRLLRSHLSQLLMATQLQSLLLSVSIASLVSHSASAFLLVSLSNSLFSNIYYNCLHISLHLLSPLTTNSSLLPTLLSFIFLHVQLLVHYDATGLFPSSVPYSSVCKPFSSSILNLPLSAICFLIIP